MNTKKNLSGKCIYCKYLLLILALSRAQNWVIVAHISKSAVAAAEHRSRTYIHTESCWGDHLVVCSIPWWWRPALEMVLVCAVQSLWFGWLIRNAIWRLCAPQPQRVYSNCVYTITAAQYRWGGYQMVGARDLRVKNLSGSNNRT